jgi:hypothetical protein
MPRLSLRLTLDELDELADLVASRLERRAAPTAAPPPSRDLAARAPAARAALTADDLAALRPYVVNLSQGLFSSEGRYATTKADVDAIFDDHLVRALAEARQNGERLRILFYAHGGLVKEESGLAIALKHVTWWRRNHVYPIYFVWETGLLETLGNLLFASQRRAAPAPRDFADIFVDPIVEDFVRRFGGPKIWGGMKESARLAVEPDGGARYVATRLEGFCAAHGADVELHAAGHSAGSIFHGHFLPAALDLGVPAFRSLHLLAPAIRARGFLNRLAPRVGNGVDHVTIFTMRRELERDDDCGGVYRKSLLYLIHHALERLPRTPILGLAESLEENADLVRTFGLDGSAAPHGEVVWSKTATTAGRSASQSTTHGGFDDDAPTMESVARRILGASDTAPITPFPSDGASRDAEAWTESLRWSAAREAGLAP